MATIQGIYIALFGRPADPAGLAFFNEATNNGADLTAIGDLAATDEYQDRFTGLSNAEIINSIYQSLFGRDGEQSGIDFFLAALEDGTYNINNIAIAILDGAQGDDLATINAKIAAAELLTERLDLDIEVDAYVGSDAAEIARNYISNVNKDDPGTESEADAAIAQMLDLQGGQAPGDDTGGNPGVVEIEATGSVTFNTPREGEEVTASDNATDGNGKIVNRAYQWQKFVEGQWVDIEDAVGKSYVIPDDESVVGQQIRVVMTTTDDNGFQTVFVSGGSAIENVNDAPVLSAESYTFSANENYTGSVGSVAATDVDGPGAITYSLSGHDATVFQINASTGEISLINARDYENLTQRQYQFEVVASDAEGATDTADVTINIADVLESIVGTSGRDTLIGTSGNDIIIGKGDADILTGGLGADTFVYERASDMGQSGRAGNGQVDRITDFQKGVDKIDLSAIDAIPGGSDDAFTFLGRDENLFPSSGGLNFDFQGGNQTNVWINVGGTNYHIVLTGQINLDASDFVL